MADDKKTIFIGLFGRKKGVKLANWLDDCCTTFCDDINTCLGISEEGSASLVLNQQGNYVSLAGGGSAITGLTAHAGGGQGSALVLTGDYNNITVVATAGDSVKLPTPILGSEVIVENNGANDLAVFPVTGGTINGAAANASLTIPAGGRKIFIGLSATAWTTSKTIAATDGTVALPGLTFNTDSDSGVYRIAANNLGVAVNGAKVLDIGTTGLGVTGTLTATTSVSAGTIFLGGLGAVGAPTYSFTSRATQGIYSISSTQLGIAIGGVLVGGANASGLFTNVISEQTTDNGVAVDLVLLRDGVVIPKPAPVAINSTAVATATQILSGVITSTSAAATAITTPTATAIAALIGAVQGTEFELVIDNSLGANTVTLTLDGSITAPAGAITGGNTLTVTTTHKVGIFRFYFTSGTTAVVYRIA